MEVKARPRSWHRPLTGIFDTVQPLGDGMGVADAATAILERAVQFGFNIDPSCDGCCWSLAELYATETDYQWLLTWAERLSPLTVETWLTSGDLTEVKAGSRTSDVTRREAFGLLLLLFCAEVGRRTATEGELWHHVACASAGLGKAERRFHEIDTHSQLFAGGQPTFEVKNILEAAARRFHLRHFFDVPYTKPWFNTVYVQFGLTALGYPDQLSLYLTGGGTRALEMLRFGFPEGVDLTHDEQVRMGTLFRSDSFRRFWDALCDYREEGNEERLWSSVGASPWVLPDWRSDMLKAARRRMHLSTSRGITPTPGDTGERGCALEITGPFLRWPVGSPPFLTLRLSGLDSLSQLSIGGGLTTYTLTLRDLPRATILCHHGGKVCLEPYGRNAVSLLEEYEVIVPEGNATQIIATLLSEDGNVVWTQELDLIDPTEEVVMFDVRSGAKLPSAWDNTVSPSTAYTVLLAGRGLALAPSAFAAGLEMRRVAGLGTFHRLPTGWPSELAVYFADDTGAPDLSDEPLWSPLLKNDRVLATPDPAWARQVVVDFDASNAASSRVSLRVNTGSSDKVQIRFVRAGGNCLCRYEGDANIGVRFGDLDIASLPPVLHVRVGLRYIADLSEGRPETRTVLVALPRENLVYVGALRLTPTGWRRLGTGVHLSRQGAETEPIRVYAPADWASDGVGTVFEGDQILTRRRLTSQLGKWRGTRLRPVPLGRTGAWGAPIRIRPHTYNSFDDQLTLATSVTDTRILSDLEFHEGSLRLMLRQPFYPDTDVSVFCWDSQGRYREAPGDQVRILDGNLEGFANGDSGNGQGSLWQVPLHQDISAETLIFVAIAYKGQRVGSYWSPFWYTALRQWPSTKALAAALWWLHAPLLDEAALPEMQRWACDAPAHVLASWLRGDCLPKGLQWGARSEDDSWPSPVRTVFRHWAPAPEEARLLVGALKASDAQTGFEKLLGTAERLVNVCPELAFRVLCVFTEDHWRRGRWSTVIARDTLRRIARHLGSKAPLLLNADAARRMGVDELFVKQLLKDAVAPLLSASGNIHKITSAQRRNCDIAIANCEAFRRSLLVRLLEAHASTRYSQHPL